MDDELSLLARARKLDPDTLAAIHDHYYPLIYRYIAARIDDPVTAEDLTSEVFTRLLSALRDRQAPANTLQGWLYGVASRVVMDHHRKQYRAPNTELHDTLVTGEGNPVEVLEAAMTREALQTALAELTQEQQQVIALRFGSDMPIRDVADLLGKTEGAVKQLQARAIAALARRLTGDE